MTILTFPAILPQKLDFGIQSRTQAFMSKLTSATQTLRMPAAYWRGSVTFDDLSVQDARLLQAFVVSLEGMNGRFYYGDISNTVPQGSMKNNASVVVRVNGANQTGGTLNVDNLPASSTVFKAGDMIHFDNADSNRELKMITSDVNSNSSGEAALSIAPNIRKAPADNVVVTHKDTACVMRLVSDGDGSWGVRSPIISTISLSFVEAIV